MRLFDDMMRSGGTGVVTEDVYQVTRRPSHSIFDFARDFAQDFIIEENAL